MLRLSWLLLQEKVDAGGTFLSMFQGRFTPTTGKRNFGGSSTLAGGRRLADREIANRFPTTYVLDRHGLVLFSHVGPVHDWTAYRDFLLDAAARSGK